MSALQDYHLPALVISSKRIAENVWHAEAPIWAPHLSVAVAAGTPAKRKAAIAQDADITTIGVDNLKDVPAGKYTTFILDELSLYKNHNTRRFKTLRKLTKDARFVWGLTGTPAPNGYQDLWSQMFLIDRGQRLGTTLGGFRDRYLFPAVTLPPTKNRPRSTVAKWGLKDGAAEAIEDAIADISLSMKSADYLDLPPVTFNDVFIDMPAKAWKAYRDMEKHLVVTVQDADYTAAGKAVAVGKLSQITSGFLMPDIDSPDDEIWHIHDARVDAVKDIVETATSPVIVFYQYREERRRLLAKIKGAKAVDAPGAIAEFMAGDVPVLVAHPASAGHGLNFQHVSHTIIWCSMTWSNELYLQANARVDRQGQQHPVVIHRVKVPDTIDQVVEDAVIAKKNVQGALLEALSAE